MNPINERSNRFPSTSMNWMESPCPGKRLTLLFTHVGNYYTRCWNTIPIQAVGWPRKPALCSIPFSKMQFLRSKKTALECSHLKKSPHWEALRWIRTRQIKKRVLPWRLLKVLRNGCDGMIPDNAVNTLTPGFLLPTSSICERFFYVFGYAFTNRHQGSMPANI